jgi:hypothetical protein
LLAITRTGLAMNQTRIGNRLVIIAGTAPANVKAGCREPAGQRATARRLVVIRNGELVGSGPGR